MGTTLDSALAVPLVQLRPGLQQGHGELFVGSWADSFLACDRCNNYLPSCSTAIRAIKAP